jgi:hypothetical protein
MSVDGGEEKGRDSHRKRENDEEGTDSLGSFSSTTRIS